MTYKICKSSKTGFTHWVTTVEFEPNAKTYAAAVLLQYDLHIQDADYLESLEGRMARVKFSRDTLSEWQRKLGSLFCVYCNKSDLQIEYDGMLLDKKVMATLEHMTPTSKNGGMFDLTNVVCACAICNGNRSDTELLSYLSARNIDQIKFFNECNTYFKLSGVDITK